MHVRIRNPWPGAEVQVVDGRHPRRVIVPTTTKATFTLHARRGRAYLVQRPSAPTASLEKAPITGTPATQARHLAGSKAQIGLDPPGVEPPTPCASRPRARSWRGTRPRRHGAGLVQLRS